MSNEFCFVNKFSLFPFVVKSPLFLLVVQIPPFSPLSQGGLWSNGNSHLWFKSPLFPPFSRGVVKQWQFPLVAQIPPFSPLSQGGLKQWHLWSNPLFSLSQGGLWSNSSSHLWLKSPLSPLSQGGLWSNGNSHLWLKSPLFPLSQGGIKQWHLWSNPLFSLSLQSFS